MSFWLWAAIIYVAIGLLWGAFIAVFAAGQGAPLGWGRFTLQALTWPYQAWAIFGPWIRCWVSTVTSRRTTASK